MAALKLVGVGIGRLSQILLPLFLVPSDFGIFALASFFYGILALAADFGMSTSLMRRKERLDEAADTAFVIRLCVAAILTIGAVGLGWGASILFSEPRLTIPLLLLTASLLLQALSMVPRIIASRALDFKRAFVPDQLGKYTGSLSTLGFAILGLAYFSPVYGLILGTAVAAILQLALSSWRPRLRFHPALAREMVTFGQFVTLGTFANLVAHSIDNALIGLLLGVAPLGLYSFAYSWGVYFTSNVASGFAAISYPLLSRVWDSQERLRRVLLENLKYYTYVALCLSGGVAVLAPLLVAGLYEPAWRPAIVPMQILSAAGLLIGYGAIAGDALYALNDPKRVLRYAFGEAAIIVVGMPAAVAYGGLLGASLCALVAAIFVSASMATSVSRRLGIPPRVWLRTVGHPVEALATAATITIVVGFFLSVSLFSLLASAFVFLATYIAGLQFLSRGSFFVELREALTLALKR